MKDIVERLRDGEMYVDACDEAARLIEEQRKQLAALQAAASVAAEQERDAYKKLAGYAYHEAGCSVITNRRVCDCGYWEARDELEAALAVQENEKVV